MKEISKRESARALKNEPLGVYEFGGREIPIHDLSYDDYIEFVELAAPIIEYVIGVVGIEGFDDALANPQSINLRELIRLAKDELPRMALLVCRQHDDTFLMEDVKELGKRPYDMLHLVLAQIKFNKMVQEFADFFPRLGQAINGMLPDGMSLKLKSLTESTPAETPASS
jgi:hypothetical protein